MGLSRKVFLTLDLIQKLYANAIFQDLVLETLKVQNDSFNAAAALTTLSGRQIKS